MSARPQTPSQTIGPFFHDALLRDGMDDLDPRGTAGRPVAIVGSVRDGAGTPVDDAMVEVLQPDGEGRFRHPLDRLIPRFYFEGDPTNADDPVLRACALELRATLLAVLDGTEDGVPRYRFDIRIQSDDETVFFAL